MSDPRTYQRRISAVESHTVRDEMDAERDELEQEVADREHDEWECLAE